MLKFLSNLSGVEESKINQKAGFDLYADGLSSFLLDHFWTTAKHMCVFGKQSSCLSESCCH